MNANASILHCVRTDSSSMIVLFSFPAQNMEMLRVVGPGLQLRREHAVVHAECVSKLLHVHVFCEYRTAVYVGLWCLAGIFCGLLD